MLVKILFRLLIILIASMSVASSQAQEENSVPLIYYYSHRDEVFIIEQADGEDRSELATFTLSDGRIVTGPGWSPSGTWLAWTSTLPGGFSLQDEIQAMVVSRADGNPINLLEGFGEVVAMEWSPTDDIILLGYIEQANNSLPKYELISMDNLQTTLTISQDELGSSEFVPYLSKIDMHWSPSGNFLALYYPHPSEDNLDTFDMRIYSKTGELIAQRLITLDFTGQRLRRQCLPQWSTTDTVAYIDGTSDQLIIEDFQTGATIQLNDDRLYTGVFDWRADGEYAFVYASIRCGSGTHASLELFRSSDASLLPLVDGVERPVSYPLDNPFAGDFLTSVWSPTGQQGTFLDDQDNLHIISLSDDAQIIPLPINTSAQLVTHSIRWDDTGRIIYFATHGEFDDPELLFSYDTSSRILQTIGKFSSDIVGDNIILSPDNRYLAYSSTNCEGVCIVDLESQDNLMIQGETPDYFDPPFAFLEIFWHPQQEWLLLTSRRQSIFRTFYVANVDGTLIRELGSGTLSQSNIGWLPDSQQN